ncbi:MAG: BlaI/MecI/CopY family transcriptional regulator [Thermoanaerobaculia bacterium]
MKTPQISDAEWEVMNVLWEQSPRSASEVVEVLGDRMKWNPSTVKTLLSRLVKKGVLRYRADGNRYFYTPGIARERYVKTESKSFVDRVFGSEAPMILHFLREADLSRDEIEELRRILDAKEEKKS